MIVVGDFVEIHGLQNAAQHNKKQGRVFGIREDGRLRLTVMSQLEGVGRIAETIAVKPQNAHKIRNYYTDDFLMDMVDFKMVFVFDASGQPQLPKTINDLPLEVRECEVGVGLFTKRGVTRGTDLFQERPLFSFLDDAEFEESEKSLEQVMKRVDQKRNHFNDDFIARMLLTGVEGPRFPVDGEVQGIHTWPAAVVKSRRFDIKDVNDTEITEIRPLCSLLNHSCCPSATVTPLGVVSIWKDLKPGEEITIAYRPEALLNPFGQRYAFGSCAKCLCSVCRQPKELQQASDQRRQQLWERAEKWFSDGCPGDDLEALQQAMAVEGLCLETTYPRSKKRKVVV